MNPCQKCGADYLLREGCEPTAFCDSCAQIVLDDLLEALEEIAQRGPIDGYSSAGALRLRLVATQSIARAALAKVKSPATSP